MCFESSCRVVVLPIPAGLLCFMRRVFQLMAEVAVT